MRCARVPLLTCLLVVFLAGCESTQDQAARLRERGTEAFSEKGVRVKRQNPNVTVVSTKAIQDENGTVAVVELRNDTRTALATLPLAMQVKDARKKVVYSNDAPGLDPALASVPLLPAGEALAWVNDQVGVLQTGGKARSVNAKVGTSKQRPGRIPRLEVSRPRLENDPFSGMLVRGKVANKSKVEQTQLRLFAVARKGGRVVAAGRGGIDRLPAEASRVYKIFFIGNPRGARVEVDAPPTVLK